MGFRHASLTKRHLPERVRHRVPVTMLAATAGGLRDTRVRTSEFPRFALELSLRA